MKLNKLALCGAILATFVGSGCNSGEPSTPAPDQKPVTTSGDAGTKKTSLKITLIAKSQNNPVFQAAKVGAEAAAAETEHPAD